MPTNLSLTLDNPSAVFFAGQTVSGHLTVTCTNDKTFREITIKFHGFSKVHWTERKSERREGKTVTKTVHYRSSEDYYGSSILVWGTGQESTLPAGTHNFNFSYVLPQNIPSSFESKIGQVRHVCKAKINVPWGFDKTCSQPYSVNSLYDLNTDPAAQHPIQCNEHKYLCCLWCKSGPLSMVLRVSRSGYVPGEKIMINAECSNKTNDVVDYTEANIHQIVKYRAQGKTKSIDRKVAEIKRPAIAAGDDDIWSGVALLIPALPPSKLIFCNNIDIYYTFKFKVSPSGCHSNLDYKVPLIIGSIPLREHFPMFRPAALPQPQPVMPLPSAPSTFGPTAPPAGFSVDPYNPNVPPPQPGFVAPSAPVFPGVQHYPDLPPPSYNECMFGADGIEEDSDDESGGMFAPKYASYNLSMAPPPYNESMLPPNMNPGGGMSVQPY
ncbi:arrestin domain-containing protein 3-like isoform X2 [Penaeus japonicus]|uniref:arrestin domain-containing protein 3-like isoform X2 n=1 Tax=Penaeus japonicus TaxID=27405 RepID=UPI001C715516|nr:arrestin domain-containing protein 3-like isoform X2 [Penaeus japonicus]